jgi:hypothetical protein
VRCDCCDKELDDVESTAKFAESGNYVNMCAGCRKWLPNDLKIITNPNLERNKRRPDLDDGYDFRDGDGLEWFDDDE